MLSSAGIHQGPRTACSSRTDTASINLSRGKYSGSVESVGFLPHLCAIQTQHITGCMFPTALLSL